MHHLSDHLTAEQVDLLMRDLHPSRVLSLDGNSYVAQHDIRAMLIRVFGFGGWSLELIEPTTLLYEQETTLKNGKAGYKVAYKASVRLTVCAPAGNPLAVYEASGTGEHIMPDFKRGDAHDNAQKTAESAAMKRAAIALGTQFGLSLYNGGMTKDIVRVLAVDPRGATVETPAETEVEVVGDDDLPTRDE